MRRQHIPALNADIELPDKPTKKGDKLIDEIVDEIVKNLLLYWKVKDETRDRQQD